MDERINTNVVVSMISCNGSEDSTCHIHENYQLLDTESNCHIYFTLLYRL